MKRLPRVLNSAICISLLALGGASCGKPTFIEESNSLVAGAEDLSEPAVRIVFHADAFTDLVDFNTPKSTQYDCVGDAHKFFKADGADYTGGLTEFASSGLGDDFSVTVAPSFLRAVSVDVTQAYYPETVADTLQTDGCSYRGVSTAALPTSCADFDRALAAIPTPTVAPTATPSPMPSPTATPSTTQYYNTNFYRVRDDWCYGQGPIISTDVETTKAFVGGVNIDLDRDSLGEGEDLLMNITYHALSSNFSSASNWPGLQNTQDQTILKVRMGQTGLGWSNLMSILQPRIWSFYQSTSYPILWQEVASLEDPLGSLRTEQVVLPISKNPSIDRIRVERVRGSFHLFQIDLYRLGDRS